MLLYTYRATLAAGVALLGVFIWLKYVKPDKWWFNTNYLATLNVVLASVCLAALLACCALFLAGTFQARRQHRHWCGRYSARRSQRLAPALLRPASQRPPGRIPA